jgi:hypothetical protein
LLWRVEVLFPRYGVEDVGETSEGAARCTQGGEFSDRLVLPPADDSHGNHEDRQNAQGNENVLFHEIPPNNSIAYLYRLSSTGVSHL